MSDTPPVLLIYEGDMFRPATPFWQKRCDAWFVIGERYAMSPENERSEKNHNHLFAQLNEIWENLPDDLIARYPTREIFRKSLLIEEGFFDLETYVMDTEADAQKFAAALQKSPGFSIVKVSECTVMRYTAKSQARRAMGSKKFTETKTAILDRALAMIGARREQLETTT
jgi:hypothetical protein